MFSLGFFGIFLMAALPLFAIHVIAGLALKIAVVAVNRSNAPVLFAASSASVATLSLFAWFVSVVLFLVCATLNYWLTQYSGDTIFRFYPLLQKVVSLAIFYWFSFQRVASKCERKPPTTRARVLWSLAAASAPTILLLAAGNLLHLARHHS